MLNPVIALTADFGVSKTQIKDELENMRLKVKTVQAEHYENQSYSQRAYQDTLCSCLG